MIVSKPCACRQERLAYMQNVVVDEDGDSHYASYCPGQRIELKPEPDSEVKAPPWPTVPRCVTHDEPIWVTGNDPVALLASLGCPCSERVA